LVLQDRGARAALQGQQGKALHVVLHFLTISVLVYRLQGKSYSVVEETMAQVGFE
jgi:hypothetical protein